MKVGFFIMVCILLAGCGLLNRTKKIDEQRETATYDEQVVVNNTFRAQRSDQSTAKQAITSTSMAQLKLYPRVGTLLHVKQDGSLSVEADSLVISDSQSVSSWQLQSLNSEEDLERQRDSVASAARVEHIERYQEQVKSRDSFWPGAARSALVVVILLLLGFVLFKYRKLFLF